MQWKCHNERRAARCGGVGWQELGPGLPRSPFRRALLDFAGLFKFWKDSFVAMSFLRCYVSPCAPPPPTPPSPSSLPLVSVEITASSTWAPVGSRVVGILNSSTGKEWSWLLGGVQFPFSAFLKAQVLSDVDATFSGSWGAGQLAVQGSPQSPNELEVNLDSRRTPILKNSWSVSPQRGMIWSIC